MWQPNRLRPDDSIVRHETGASVRAHGTSHLKLSGHMDVGTHKREWSFVYIFGFLEKTVSVKLRITSI